VGAIGGPSGEASTSFISFIQIIEMVRTLPDAVEALVDEWRVSTDGNRTAERGTFTLDRNRPNTYVQIVEFPPYEEALANSDLPETAGFAGQLAGLCNGPMVFRNLDARRVEEM
jgi:hypothetical protein